MVHAETKRVTEELTVDVILHKIGDDVVSGRYEGYHMGNRYVISYKCSSYSQNNWLRTYKTYRGYEKAMKRIEELINENKSYQI